MSSVNIFQKVLTGRLSKYQMISIQIKTVRMSVLILVQTVSNGYQATTKVAASEESVNSLQVCTLTSRNILFVLVGKMLIIQSQKISKKYQNCTKFHKPKDIYIVKTRGDHSSTMRVLAGAHCSGTYLYS